MTTIRDIIAAMRASQDWSAEEVDVLVTMARRAERDINAHKHIAALEAENAALRAELADTKRKHDATLTHLFAARQSRARLVDAVREQRELLKAARLIRAELRQEVADLTTEADAARAWAATWKRAAKWWRDQALHWGRESQIMTWWNEWSRRARAAAEAATETQARYWNRILTDEERAELYRAGLDISAAEAMERR